MASRVLFRHLDVIVLLHSAPLLILIEMWFLMLIGWLSTLIQLAFVVLCIAAGLYYLAEAVEEYTVIAGKVIRYLVFSIIVVYLGLLVFESFPYTLVSLGIASQISYLLILNNFPYFYLTSPVFISSLVLLLVNHYYSFIHFANSFYPFNQVLGFFTFCLWIVPFSFFISLSANDNVLPTYSETRPLLGDHNDLVTHYLIRKGKKIGLLSFFNYAKESILPEKMKKSF